MTHNNLCSSCTNIGCEFQSGIIRTKCAFYMPPHIESDNCGNYVVRQPTVDVLEQKTDLNEAVRIAYEQGRKDALEVLDKIRAEILNFKEKCNASDYLGCGILEIIDKYNGDKE